MPSADLERLVDAALRRLPPPRAPRSLVPRVMAVVNEWSSAPWYRRAWFRWPIEWQVVAVATLIALTAGTGMLLTDAGGTVAAAALGAPAVGTLASVPHYVGVALDIGEVLWRTIVEPVVPYVFALVLLMCLACAAFGTALNHVVLGRMSEP